MTATAINTNGWAPISGAQSPIPPTVRLPLSTTAPGQVGRGQLASVDASGNAILNDGTTPNLMPAGTAFPEILSDQALATGAAATDFWQGLGSGNPASTIASDGFAASDWGVPFWIKDENTPGKLSNSGGSNRSLGGLVFGLDNLGNPRLYSGGIAGLLARATLVTQAKDRAWWSVADAAAGSTAAETAMYQEKLHGVVTNVEWIPTSTNAADASNYGTLTVSKRNGAGGGATTVATLSTQTSANGAQTAFVTSQFTLATAAGALNLLETDILTVTETKSGSGTQLNGTIRVVQKVI